GKHPAVVYLAVQAAAGDAPLNVLSRRDGWGEDHLQLHRLARVHRAAAGLDGDAGGLHRLAGDVLHAAAVAAVAAAAIAAAAVVGRAVAVAGDPHVDGAALVACHHGDLAAACTHRMDHAVLIDGRHILVAGGVLAGDGGVAGQ